MAMRIKDMETGTIYTAPEWSPDESHPLHSDYVAALDAERAADDDWQTTLASLIVQADEAEALSVALDQAEAFLTYAEASEASALAAAEAASERVRELLDAMRA
jgi:hypothetical protein